MNGDKKFKKIYDKFGGSYGDLIIEHLRVLNELEKCRQLLAKQTSKKIKDKKWKQNVKVAEKWEIVRNFLVNIFVMPVTIIDLTKIKLRIYLLFWHFDSVIIYTCMDK